MGQDAGAALAAHVLRSAKHDHSDLFESPGAVVVRPDRHGVRVVVAPTSAFSERALDALLAWRLGQYLMTGFYDPAIVRAQGMRGEDRGDVNADDLHGLAIDQHGAILCYVTMKRAHADRRHRFVDPDRPVLPCESIHGRAWQARLELPEDVTLESTWEFGRFCKDQRRGRFDAASRRAPLELALVVARLSRHPSYQAAVRLVVGDFDPDVALRNLRFFFVPVATFPPHQVRLPADHPLGPRYRDHATAPFAADPSDADEATYVRWVDVDLALSCDDAEASRRLKALRHFVSVRESGLKRPSQVAGPESYPTAALTASSAHDAATALWDSAAAGHGDWLPRTLGPGEAVDRSRAVWVIDGYLQAFTAHRGGRTHLAGVGPDVAFVPDRDDDDGVVQAIEAATPARVLTASAERFEDFWGRRQQIFETSTSSLYGDVALTR